MTNDVITRELLRQLHDVAIAGGHVIKKFYDQGSDLESWNKKGGSLVSQADIETEKTILPMIRELTPDIPIVSEEAYEDGKIPNVTNEKYFWLIDPIDGTRGFINRTARFCLCMGLVMDHRATLGIIHMPQKNTTYGGIVGDGAFQLNKDDDGITQFDPISTRDIPDDGARAVIGYSSGKGGTVPDDIEGIPISRVHKVGSAVKFALIADGRADVHYNFAHCFEWDAAAGHAIVDAAGGQVTRIDGAPLLYGKPKFRNVPLLAKGWKTGEIEKF